MTTGSRISGSADVSRMVCGPAPGMLKRIISGPPELAVAFALVIASLREPAPRSAVLVTAKKLAGRQRSSSASSSGRRRDRGEQLRGRRARERNERNTTAYLLVGV